MERCELSIVEGKPTVEGEEVDEDEDSLESKFIVRLHCKHGQFSISTHFIYSNHIQALLKPTACYF